nr:MAG TPA: hypothetical protein [Caudoviricetes sp.]
MFSLLRYFSPKVSQICANIFLCINLPYRFFR